MAHVRQLSSVAGGRGQIQARLDEGSRWYVFLAQRIVKYVLTRVRPASDIGAVSILWSQPVTALQILSPDGKWCYGKHVPNGIIRVLRALHPLSLPANFRMGSRS